MLDERFYDRYGLPHKFKMGISGYPNVCAKHNENDLSFIAVVEPILKDKDAWRGYGLCLEVWPGKAIEVVNDKPVFKLTKYFHDGKCIGVCPNDALGINKTGWQVFAGGK